MVTSACQPTIRNHTGDKRIFLLQQDWGATDTSDTVRGTHGTLDAVSIHLWDPCLRHYSSYNPPPSLNVPFTFTPPSLTP